MHLKNWVVLLQASTMPFVLKAQDSAKAGLSFSAYAEIYYQYDFNQPANGTRPGFIYSHNRHNEFNLNLGYVKAAYNSEKFRANLAWAAGTYMNANYTAEPGVLKNILEANAGVRLSKKRSLWLEAGIFPSHIGFESAISKDCWTLTRSLLAENTPYFEAGAKITYTSRDEKWLFSLLALNGWQRITRLNGNSMMSWGTQMQYKPSDRLLLNYSTFWGTDKPDSARLVRSFHNTYAIFSLTKKLGLTLGFDIGLEEKSKSGGRYYSWCAPVAILKYSFGDKWTVSGRWEYYRDKNGVIISTATPNGFQTAGYSVNADLVPSKNILLRLEGRVLTSRDKIFVKGDRSVNNNVSITGSVSVSF